MQSESERFAMKIEANSQLPTTKTGNTPISKYYRVCNSEGGGGRKARGVCVCVGGLFSTRHFCRTRRDRILRPADAQLSVKVAAPALDPAPAHNRARVVPTQGDGDGRDGCRDKKVGKKGMGRNSFRCQLSAISELLHSSLPLSHPRTVCLYEYSFKIYNKNFETTRDACVCNARGGSPSPATSTGTVVPLMLKLP
jgi:hypothetical protein